jgi:mitochondrial import receptor subunit TOM40
MKLYHIYVQVATGQIATTGMVALSYVQKVSQKVSVFISFFLLLDFFFSLRAASFHSFFVQVSLASDFMYNQMSKDVTATFGYDYMLRQVTLFS